MTAEADLHVEVQGVEIVVTLPRELRRDILQGGGLPQQLLTKSHSGREDHGAKDIFSLAPPKIG